MISKVLNFWFVISASEKFQISNRCDFVPQIWGYEELKKVLLWCLSSCAFLELFCGTRRFVILTWKESKRRKKKLLHRCWLTDALLDTYFKFSGLVHTSQMAK